MLENIKIYTSDACWNHIFSELGVCVVDEPKNADVIFDGNEIPTPVSGMELQKIILDKFENKDIIKSVFGDFVVLPELQHKIVVALYKNPNISMVDLKKIVGISPDIKTHTVENAVYNLRKKYGRNFIKNTDGGYKIECL